MDLRPRWQAVLLDMDGTLVRRFRCPARTSCSPSWTGWAARGVTSVDPGWPGSGWTRPGSGPRC